MVEEDDWRLFDIAGLHQCFDGIHIKWKAYELGFPGYDHDHCEFCWQKIAAFDYPESQREGYATNDNLRWICKNCFDDFSTIFTWNVD